MVCLCIHHKHHHLWYVYVYNISITICGKNQQIMNPKRMAVTYSINQASCSLRKQSTDFSVSRCSLSPYVLYSLAQYQTSDSQLPTLCTLSSLCLWGEHDLQKDSCRRLSKQPDRLLSMIGKVFLAKLVPAV